MFLHSGADMHRHEFSAPREHHSDPIPGRFSLPRSAFSTPISRRAPTYGKPSSILYPSTGPARLASEHISRTASEPLVRFQTPEADTMSEDGRSVANSEGSEATAGGGRRRKRNSTAFHLAHPAPTLTQKQRLLQIRPRLLLQLQKLSAESRPKPAIDVLPSTVVVPRVVKKFPRMFRGKAELGANDVMVVKSEEYDTSDDHVSEDNDSDEEGLANRDLMAVICQLRKDSGGSHGKAEIVLRDGSVWEATPLSNGLYEFNTVDERGGKITARWVRKSIRCGNLDPIGGNEFKFTFSIINPNSRRHPVMASITHNTLDIPDYYTSVSPSSRKHPPTSLLRPVPGDPERQNVDDEPTPEPSTHVVDDDMKTLIQVTGIWVALRQGLSPYFRYSDALATASAASGGRVRSLTLVADGGRASPAGTCSSTPESTLSTFGVVGGRMRRTCAKGNPSTITPPQFEQAGPPKRSVSTGAAFMQRAAALRAGNGPSTVASDSEGEGISYPPKRAASDNLTGTVSNPVSTPQPHSRPASAATTLDTPTKPHRRVQSAFVPSSAPQNGFKNKKAHRHSVGIMDGKQASDSSGTPKIGRWRAFTNFFRRSRSITRSD